VVVVCCLNMVSLVFRMDSICAELSNSVDLFSCSFSKKGCGVRKSNVFEEGQGVLNFFVCSYFPTSSVGARICVQARTLYWQDDVSFISFCIFFFILIFTAMNIGFVSFYGAVAQCAKRRYPIV